MEGELQEGVNETPTASRHRSHWPLHGVTRTPPLFLFYRQRPVAFKDCELGRCSKIMPPGWKVTLAKSCHQSTRLRAAQEGHRIAAFSSPPDPAGVRAARRPPPRVAHADGLRRNDHLDEFVAGDAILHQHVDGRLLSRDADPGRESAVGQFRELCHASVRRPLVSVAGHIRRLLRGAMPMIRGDESDGDAGLDPDRPSLRDEALGAVLGGEPAAGNRVLDPDALEHSSGVCPGGIAGMPAREPKARWEGCGICERPRAPLGERQEAFYSISNTACWERQGKNKSLPCCFYRPKPAW